VNVNVVAKTKVYGEADPAFTYTFSPALIGTDVFTGSLNRVPGENIGNYAITQGTLALNSNYTLVFTPANLNITTKALTINAVIKTKVYGTVDPALTYTFSPALIGTDTFTGNLNRIPGENIGNYAITQGTVTAGSNYVITYNTANLSITPKALAVSAVAKTKTYGDTDPALTYTFSPALIGTDAFTGSLTRVPGENIGNYAITQGTVTAGPNYQITYTPANLSIGTKTINVTATTAAKTYGTADPALAYTFSPALIGTDLFTGSLSRAPGENIGTYTINQGTLALSANYTLNYTSANLTIGKKTVTVTADAKTKIFTTADPALTYTFNPALIGTDTFTGNLDRAAGEAVGTYVIGQGNLSLGTNYQITYVPANLTITSQTITVTAAAITKVYGDTDPALTYTFSPALNGTDSFTGSLDRAAGENVGTYAINQGTLALSGNYILNYISSDLTINKKTVTVTAEAKNKTYGDADPALTYTFAPTLVTGDSFSGSLSRTAGENVGTYAINQGTLALSGNYILEYTSANLTIGNKTVTVTASSQTKVYGTTDPELTYTFTPTLVAGDVFTGVLTRAAGEDVGTYAIGQGNLNAGANYAITYVGNDFIITKADQTITWNQTLESGCDGETTIVLTATSNSGLPVSYTSSNTDIATVSNSLLTFNDYGSATITASQAGNNNYNAAIIVVLPIVNSQPNLIRKQFEDVIFFDNSSKNFESYTWYKNGVLVPNQTHQFYKENGDLNGTYHALAVKLDGTLITTCPLTLSPTAEEEYVKLVPNPVKPSANYELITNISSSRIQNARVEVYSIGGILMENKTTSQSTVTLEAPTVEGIYIVKMTLANGKYFTKNILVKK
jgi:hypothetical protein